MSISRIPTLRALAVAAALVASLPGTGCARSGAAPPQPPTGNAEEVRSASTTTPEPARPPVPDPSEEITPEELATIPEPVPPSAGGGRSVPARSPLPVAREASQTGLLAGAPDEKPTALWRVQVFATQDRGLADRMAREAADRLGARAHVTREASQYKVRLGDFRSEEEARPLREKAVRDGFPGAFRIRCPLDTSDSID